MSDELPNVVPLSRDRPRMSRRQAEVCAWRMQGLTYRQIAEETGLSIKTVENYLHAARQRAQLRDIPDLLDHTALPLAVDNLIEGLRNGDQKYTLATLKGRGAFVTSTKQENTTNATAGLTLTLKVEMPEGAAARDLDTLEGEVVGVPLVLKESSDGQSRSQSSEGAGDAARPAAWDTADG